MKATKKKPAEFNHNITLISILGTGFSLFALYRFNRHAQRAIILITALSYILWGIIHHKLSHYLTREIIFEYILVAAIGSLVLLSLLGY